MCAETNTALLTGTFALAGVALSIATSALLSFWDKSHKRKVLLREKYEELSMAFLDSFEMPQKLMSHAGSIEEVHALTHQTHGNRVQMLSLLYFEELQSLSSLYTQTYSDLCVVAYSLFDHTKGNTVGEQVYNKEEYISARESHLDSRDQLQDAIKLYAKKYANV